MPTRVLRVDTGFKPETYGAKEAAATKKAVEKGPTNRKVFYPKQASWLSQFMQALYHNSGDLTKTRTCVQPQTRMKNVGNCEANGWGAGTYVCVRARGRPHALMWAVVILTS